MDRIVYGMDSTDHTYYVDFLQDYGRHRVFLRHGFRVKNDAMSFALSESEKRDCECLSEDW